MTVFSVFFCEMSYLQALEDHFWWQNYTRKVIGQRSNLCFVFGLNPHRENFRPRRDAELSPSRLTHSNKRPCVAALEGQLYEIAGTEGVDRGRNLLFMSLNFRPARR